MNKCGVAISSAEIAHLSLSLSATCVASAAGVLRRDTFSEAANCRSGLGRAKRLLDSVEVKGVDRKDVERIKVN